MFTFLLIASASKRLEIYSLLSGLGVVRRESGQRCLAHAAEGMQDGWLAMQPLDGAEMDYDELEIERVTSLIEDPCFFLVEGRDGKDNFSNRFVLGLEEPETLLIDNDHGLIERASRIQQRINAGENWLRLHG